MIWPEKEISPAGKRNIASRKKNIALAGRKDLAGRKIESNSFCSYSIEMSSSVQSTQYNTGVTGHNIVSCIQKRRKLKGFTLAQTQNTSPKEKPLAKAFH